MCAPSQSSEWRDSCRRGGGGGGALGLNSINTAARHRLYQTPVHNLMAKYFGRLLQCELGEESPRRVNAALHCLSNSLTSTRWTTFRAYRVYIAQGDSFLEWILCTKFLPDTASVLEGSRNCGLDKIAGLFVCTSSSSSSSKEPEPDGLVFNVHPN